MSVFLLILSGLLFPPSLLAKIAGYGEVEKIAIEIWNDRFPVPLESIQSNPNQKGVLTARYKGKTVYYYFFSGVVPILHRESGSTEMVQENKRHVTFWLRYRPGNETPYDLTFARQDLLPGSGKRWIRVR